MAKVHALLVGVSDYPYLLVDNRTSRTFGLESLGSAALTVVRVAEWLQAHGLAGRSVGSCAVLAAPSPMEVAQLGSSVEAATCTHADFMREVNAWRERASQDSDDLAFFYFAGHGVQRKQRDHVLLLQDFGDGVGGVLSKAFDSTTLIDGMAITDDFPKMSRLQMYFFDACRMSLDYFTRYAGNGQPWALWDSLEPDNQQRSDRFAPVLHTATDGSRSFGIEGEQSVFSDALLRCLDGAAAQEDGEYGDGRLRWSVTLTSLLKGLATEIQESNRAWETQQTFDCSGLRDDFLLHEVDPPPDAEIAVVLSPDGAHMTALLEVLDDTDEVRAYPPPPIDPHPYEVISSAGYYTIRAHYPDGPYKTVRRLVSPPRRCFNLALEGP